MRDAPTAVTPGFPEDRGRARWASIDDSASFLATLDRMHLTAIAGAEALSETRRRDALVQGLREIRRTMAHDDSRGRANLADVRSVPPELEFRCQELREEQRMLVERLDAVAESLVYGDALPDIVPRVVDLVAAIRTHELDERDLQEQVAEVIADKRE